MALKLSQHAQRRMAQRAISVTDVEEVLAEHVVVEENPDEIRFPERLLLGWIGSRPRFLIPLEDIALGDFARLVEDALEMNGYHVRAAADRAS